MIATLVKKLEGTWKGDARLYKLDVPVKIGYQWDDDKPDEREETNFVVVSAVHEYFAHETYIFPSDGDGNILDWGELDGSYRGGTDHERALNNAGYVVVE